MTGLLEQYKHSSQLSCDCDASLWRAWELREEHKPSFYGQKAQTSSRAVALSPGTHGICDRQRAECRVPVLHLFSQDSSCPHFFLKNTHQKAETVVFSSVPDSFPFKYCCLWCRRHFSLEKRWMRGKIIDIYSVTTIMGRVTKEWLLKLLPIIKASSRFLTDTLKYFS